jgi:hypothetical protein
VKVPCCCIMLAEMNVMLVESINICCKLWENCSYWLGQRWKSVL